jgi:hypothetical protein
LLTPRLLFYVMPLVDGESLRARLEREKQLPVDEAARISVAIAKCAGSKVCSPRGRIIDRGIDYGTVRDDVSAFVSRYRNSWPS